LFAVNFMLDLQQVVFMSLFSVCFIINFSISFFNLYHTIARSIKSLKKLPCGLVMWHTKKLFFECLYFLSLFLVTIKRVFDNLLFFLNHTIQPQRRLFKSEILMQQHFAWFLSWAPVLPLQKVWAGDCTMSTGRCSASWDWNLTRAASTAKSGLYCE